MIKASACVTTPTPQVRSGPDRRWQIRPVGECAIDMRRHSTRRPPRQWLKGWAHACCAHPRLHGGALSLAPANVCSEYVVVEVWSRNAPRPLPLCARAQARTPAPKANTSDAQKTPRHQHKPTHAHLCAALGVPRGTPPRRGRAAVGMHAQPHPQRFLPATPPAWLPGCQRRPRKGMVQVRCEENRKRKTQGIQRAAPQGHVQPLQLRLLSGPARQRDTCVK